MPATQTRRAANVDRFAITLRATLSEAGRASPSDTKPTSNLTINRATRILVAAGILPSPFISITDNKSGRVKNNRVASITVQNGEHMEGITARIDAALAAGGYKVGWYYKANGDKQTAYQTTV